MQPKSVERRVLQRSVRRLLNINTRSLFQKYDFYGDCWLLKICNLLGFIFLLSTINWFCILFLKKDPPNGAISDPRKPESVSTYGRPRPSWPPSYFRNTVWTGLFTTLAAFAGAVLVKCFGILLESELRSWAYLALSPTQRVLSAWSFLSISELEWKVIISWAWTFAKQSADANWKWWVGVGSALHGAHLDQR